MTKVSQRKEDELCPVDELAPKTQVCRCPFKSRAGVGTTGYRQRTQHLFWCEQTFCEGALLCRERKRQVTPASASLYPGHFTQTRPNGPVRHLCWVFHSNICEDNRLLRRKSAVISSCPHCHTARRNRIQRWSEAVRLIMEEGRPTPDMSSIWKIPSFPFVFFSTHLRQNSEDCNGRRTKKNKSQGVVFIIVVRRGFSETEVEGSRRLKPWWFGWNEETIAPTWLLPLCA